MNLNEAISLRNKERVYKQANEYLKTQNSVPKQADVIALCPGMARRTMKKYYDEWLCDNNLIVSEDDEIEFSDEYQAAKKKEIKRLKAQGNHEIREQLDAAVAANEILIAENEELNIRVQHGQSEIKQLSEKLGYYQGQFEMQGGEITKLSNELQHAEKCMQICEKAIQDALARERDMIAKLSEALAREQQALSDLKIQGESTRHSEILAKILEWIERAPEKRVPKIDKRHGKAVQQIRT